MVRTSGKAVASTSKHSHPDPHGFQCHLPPCVRPGAPHPSDQQCCNSTTQHASGTAPFNPTTLIAVLPYTYHLYQYRLRACRPFRYVACPCACMVAAHYSNVASLDTKGTQCAQTQTGKLSEVHEEQDSCGRMRFPPYSPMSGNMLDCGGAVPSQWVAPASTGRATAATRPLHVPLGS